MSQKEALGFVLMLMCFVGGMSTASIALGSYKLGAVLGAVWVVLGIAGEGIKRDMI